jgi:hypothetical protein
VGTTVLSECGISLGEDKLTVEEEEDNFEHKRKWNTGKAYSNNNG